MYTVKHSETGAIEKLKARYVVCGYEQVAGIDYISTKADVAETRTFRLADGYW